MTKNNKMLEYLEGSECGDWIMGDDRRCVEVSNMVGGRYLMVDGDGEFAGATNDVWNAVEFLKSGKIIKNGEEKR